MEPSDLQLLKVTIAYYRAANDLMMAKINEQDTVLKKIFGDLDPGIRNIIAENVKGIRIVNTTAEKMANRLLGQLSHDPESSKNGVERYTGMAMQKLEQKAMDKVNSARSVTASEGAQRQTHQEVEALNKRKKVRDHTSRSIGLLTQGRSNGRQGCGILSMMRQQRTRRMG